MSNSKKVQSNPPFKIMIAKAIIAEGSKSGSTRQYIKKYLEANYNIKPTNPWINKTISALTKATEGPRLIVNRYHSGHFRCSPELKELVEKFP